MESRIGFGKRLLALLIDSVICVVVAFLLGPTIGGLFGAAAGGAAGMASGLTPGSESAAAAGMLGAFVGAAVAMIVIATAYFLIEGFTGWTPGKLILGIQVANADGTKASTGTLLTRYLAKNVNAVLGLLALITGVAVLKTIGGLLGLVIFVGCFFVLGAARQAFHDMLAKTAVYPRAMVH